MKKWKSLNWEIGASRSCGGDFRRLCFIWKFRNAGVWLAERWIDFREPDQSQFVIDCSTRCSKNGALGLRTKYSFFYDPPQRLSLMIPSMMRVSFKVRQDHTTRPKSRNYGHNHSSGRIVVNIVTGERIKQIFIIKSTTTDYSKSPKTMIFRAILKSLRITLISCFTPQSPRHCSQNRQSSNLWQDLWTFWQEQKHAKFKDR